MGNNNNPSYVFLKGNTYYFNRHVPLDVREYYKVMHSFRRSMRDRLREVDCLSDMIYQIGGWRKKSVGEGYGEGYSLKAISFWLLKTNLNIINWEYPDSCNLL